MYQYQDKRQALGLAVSCRLMLVLVQLALSAGSPTSNCSRHTMEILPNSSDKWSVRTGDRPLWPSSSLLLLLLLLLLVLGWAPVPVLLLGLLPDDTAVVVVAVAVVVVVFPVAPAGGTKGVPVEEEEGGGIV